MSSDPVNDGLTPAMPCHRLPHIEILLKNRAVVAVERARQKAKVVQLPALQGHAVWIMNWS